MTYLDFLLPRQQNCYRNSAVEQTSSLKTELSCIQSPMSGHMTTRVATMSAHQYLYVVNRDWFSHQGIMAKIAADFLAVSMIDTVLRYNKIIGWCHLTPEGSSDKRQNKKKKTVVQLDGPQIDTVVVKFRKRDELVFYQSSSQREAVFVEDHVVNWGLYATCPYSHLIRCHARHSDSQV